jgi:hypothetical protein
VVIGLLAGILGMALVQVGRHLWQDHLALHELAQIEMQRMRAGQAPSK